MDILIKNMEMPVDHGIFLVICPNGTIEQMVGTADNGYPIYNIVKDAKAIELPEHKKAYWRNAMCSNCGAVRLVSASGNFYGVNYCHNCGAEIVEATE